MCPRIVSPYPVRLKHSFKFQVLAVSLDNEVCVSAVCCLLQFQNDTQRLKKKTHICSELAELTCGELFFIISSLRIQSDPICCSHPSVQFDSLHKYDDVHLIINLILSDIILS